MMKLHQKTRIEIIAEAPVENRLVKLLDQHGVKGYTIIPAISGRGEEGAWHREGMVTGAGQMIVLVCILDSSGFDALIEDLYEFMQNRIGIISVSNVDVIRDEHF